MVKGSSATIVSATTRLTGDLTADEEIVLAGFLEGTLRSARSVHVAATGSIQGAIHAESVLVLGQVEGPIYAEDRIELQAGCSVTGDLSAQRVRIHEEAIFNGKCQQTGPGSMRRDYLVPVILQSFEENPDSSDLLATLYSAERFILDFGFDVEVRPEQTEGSPLLRHIFRSREPLTYAHLRERLRFIEHALQSATAPESTGTPEETDSARALVDSLEPLRSAALLLGPVILTRFEEDNGARLTVRVRQDALPLDGPASGPFDASSLLVGLESVQNEVVRDLSASAAARARRMPSGA